MRVSFFVFMSLSLLFTALSSHADTNGVMMQYFHWYTPDDGKHWKEIENNAHDLAAAGVTALWLPPATKGMAGPEDVGYGLYDLYDLGEFNQKGAIRTKYGTKDEYLSAIQAAHRAGLFVYSDLNLNHMGGADQTEWIRVVRVDPFDRNRVVGDDLDILAWTRFLFSGRGGKYSNFNWSWFHFDGTDWDQNLQQNAIYKFRGEYKHWDWDVDHENGNFDYLLLNDIDLEHPEVRAELKNWGKWFTQVTAIDGFRIDAAKHTQFEFVLEWLRDLEHTNSKTYFSVAEYWTHDLNIMRQYIQKTAGKVALFDFPLQDHLAQASRERGYYDLSKLYDGTLVQADPVHAVTFADNHDTQRHLKRVSRIQDWFKPLAYTLLLLRREGYPCVFYPDYFGANYLDTQSPDSPQLIVYTSFRSSLDRLLALRRDYAHGPQHSYFDDRDIVGWTREGDEAHPKAMAVVISDNFSDGGAGEKRMFVGAREQKTRVFKDATGNFTHSINVGVDGMGTFPVKNASDQLLGQSVSIWVEQ